MGVEEHLSSSAPKKAKVQLAELRSMIPKLSDRAATNRVNRLVFSQPYFRGAYIRHCRAKGGPVLSLLKDIQGYLRRVEADLGKYLK